MLFFTRRSQRETFLLQPLVGPQTHESTYLWLCNLFRQKCVRAVAEMFQSFKETQSQPADSASPKPRNTRSVGVTAFSASLLMGLRGRGRGEPSFSLHLSQENIHSHAPLHLAFYNT